MPEKLHQPSIAMMIERFRAARNAEMGWKDLITVLSGELPAVPIHTAWTEAASTILQKTYGIDNLHQINEAGMRVIQSKDHLTGLHTHDGTICHSSYSNLNARIG